MKDLRIDIIKTKLKIIEENIEIVKKFLPNTFKEFKSLGLLKDGIYKKIEASIQETLKICSIINADLNLGIPANREDIISSLFDKKIISKKMRKIIHELKGFRNFLVHRYGEINDKIAFDDIKNGLADFSLFKKEINNFLNSLDL